jgi:hypothetical protein
MAQGFLRYYEKMIDWSGDIDTKPRYDRIRTMEQVVYNKKEKGGEQC